MDALFRLEDRSLVLRPGVKVIKAPDLASWRKGQELLADVRQRCDELLREAEAEAARLRQQGYQEGCEEGRREHSEKILETVLSSVEFLEGVEKKLVDVVTQSLRKIVGNMDADERIVCVVREALHAVRESQQLTLRVALEDEKAVRESLGAMLSAAAGASALRLVADARLMRGSCLLESEVGVVDAGVETQLAVLEKAFKAKVVA